LCFGIPKLRILAFNCKALLLGGPMATIVAPLLAWMQKISLVQVFIELQKVA
jgi:hypothetical protein